MKTLYISDLDGTLLDNNAELSGCTVETLNRLIESGGYFSIATARTAATSLLILEPVAVNIPIILMNGVLIYDIQSRQYIIRELLHRPRTAQLLAAMRQTGQTGLMYALAGDELLTYYERLDTAPLQAFVNTRRQKYNKQFIQIDDFADASAAADIIYFCFLDSCEHIHRLNDRIKEIIGLRIEMYQDIYSEDLWYLEVFSDAASKKKAVQYLRQQYGFDRIVGFGDNLNDLPLFAACDECYAVANAKAEVKDKATAVIGSNKQDGVAKWLAANLLYAERY